MTSHQGDGLHCCSLLHGRATCMPCLARVNSCIYRWYVSFSWHSLLVFFSLVYSVSKGLVCSPRQTRCFFTAWYLPYYTKEEERVYFFHGGTACTMTRDKKSKPRELTYFLSWKSLLFRRATGKGRGGRMPIYLPRGQEDKTSGGGEERQNYLEEHVRCGAK